MPEASRRSMKMTPPWSRRRATQPAKVTCCPASLSRSEPAAWLRSTNTPFHARIGTSAQSRGAVGWYQVISASRRNQHRTRRSRRRRHDGRRAAVRRRAPVLLCGHTPRDGIELRPDGADPIVVPGPVHTDPGVR